MFKPILLFAVIMFFSAETFGQNNTAPKEEKENSLKKGKFAVQIGVGENFTLKSFEDFTLAAKYHISSRIALRLSGSADYHHFEGSQYIYYITPPEGYVYDPDMGDVRSYYTQLQFIYYLNPKSDINVYLGIGPRGSYASNTERYNYENGDYNVRYNELWSLGGTASLGFEWFPIKSISLTAEYFAYFQKGKTHYSSTYYLINGTKTKKYTTDYDTEDFYWKNAFLGVTLYFSL